MSRLSDWLAKNTVLFSEPDFDGLNPGYGNYTFWERIKAAFIKTFPADGYDHNTRSYYGRKDNYLNNQYSKFIESPSLYNPAVSFFGMTGLQGIWRVFYVVKVPVTTLTNTLRLLTEFPLYVLESGFLHLLFFGKQKRQIMSKGNQNIGEKSSKESFIQRGFFRLLFSLFILFSASGYYLFKSLRLTVRLVTAPIESAKEGWDFHPLFGVISTLLSIVLNTALIVFALPLALPLVAKLVGAQAASGIAKGITVVKNLFPGALPVMTSVISTLGMIVKRAFGDVVEFIQGRNVKPINISKEEERDKSAPQAGPAVTIQPKAIRQRQQKKVVAGPGKGNQVRTQDRSLSFLNYTTASVSFWQRVKNTANQVLNNSAKSSEEEPSCGEGPNL